VLLVMCVLVDVYCATCSVCNGGCCLWYLYSVYCLVLTVVLIM